MDRLITSFSVTNPSSEYRRGREEAERYPNKVKHLPHRRRFSFPGLPSPVVSFLRFLLSGFDRFFGLRLTVYGWELHFSREGFLSPIEPEVEPQLWGAFRFVGWLFRCPACAALNFCRPFILSPERISRGRAGNPSAKIKLS